MHICANVRTKPFDIAATMQEAVGLHRQGRLREAEKLYARVLKAAPQNFDALHLSGLCHAQSGRMGEAFRSISAAVKINAQVADAWLNLANVLHALKREGEALAALDNALALRPGDPQALCNRGNALLTLNQPLEALACFDRLLTLDPRHRDALLGRGSARAALGQAADALADFDAVLATAAGDPGALYNRGNVLLDLGRHDEALAAYDAAVSAAPGNAKAWNNRGRAQQALNRHTDALGSFEQAIAQQRDYADAHSNAALSRLALGDYARGFADYEWRWSRSGMSDTRRSYRGPLWLGEYPLAHRTILLHAEQGLGDTIQFARYVPILARAGATVRLEVQPALKDLFADLAGAASVHARGDALPSYDVHCPLGSLPLALKTTPDTIPADIPYLWAQETRMAKWRPRIESLGGKRVALVWSGNPAHTNDRNRSIDLNLLAPLLALAGVSFVGLQRDLRAGEADLLARHPQVKNIGAELADLADTAAVLSFCDLLIAVDTAAAHLAGALGQAPWVLLAFSPDWRWTVQTERSPWYPQARLFRQTAPGDWASVVTSVRYALAPLVEA